MGCTPVFVLGHSKTCGLEIGIFKDNFVVGSAVFQVNNGPKFIKVQICKCHRVLPILGWDVRGRTVPQAPSLRST